MALTLLFAAPTAMAAPSAPAGKLASTKASKAAVGEIKLPAVEMFKLANGLQVAVLPVDTAPVVAVQVWYHVGSKDEPRDRRGSAHMFEHMMFKGTEHVAPEEHARHLNRLGGYVNARTEEDSTHYIDVLPSAYLDFALQLEAERMRNLLFRPEMIAKEKQVVEEEIRQQENAPIQKGFLKFLSIAFQKHPYAWTAGGTIADLENTTPADLKKFYDTYYQPNNALLVVVGKVTVEQVKASAEKRFGSIAVNTAPVPRPAEANVEPPQLALRAVSAEPGPIGIVLAGFKIPAAKHPDIYALQLASIILGTGDSSRLKQRIKQEDPKTKKPLGVEAGINARVLEDPGIMIALGAFLDPDGGAAVQAALFDEIEKLGKTGPTKDEVRKAKNGVQSLFVFSLEDVNGLADQIGRSWILTGDPSQWVKDLQEFEKVSAADIQRVVATYMQPAHATVVVIPPPNSGPPQPPAQPNSSTGAKQ